MGPSWGRGRAMRRYLQFYIFMNLPLHPEERKIVSPLPHLLHCLSLAFCSLFQDPMPPPGFPPSPASPPLILWTHCSPGPHHPSQRAPGPAPLLPLSSPMAEVGRGSASRPVIWEPAHGLWSPGPTSQPPPHSSGRSLPLPVPRSARSSSKRPQGLVGSPHPPPPPRWVLASPGHREPPPG